MVLYIDFKRDVNRYLDNHTTLINQVNDGAYPIEEARALLQQDIDKAFELEKEGMELGLEKASKSIANMGQASIELLNSIGRGYKHLSDDTPISPMDDENERDEDEDETKR